MGRPIVRQIIHARNFIEADRRRAFDWPSLMPLNARAAARRVNVDADRHDVPAASH